MGALLKSEVYIDENFNEEDPLFTEAEYLEIEKSSQNKLEFRNGRIYSMAGASFGHGTISGNLHLAFKVHLRGKPCKSVQDTLKVKNKRCDSNTHNMGDRFYYIPDVVVDCGQVTRKTEYTKEPVIIVEVLSSSTRDRDLYQKFRDYRTLESLQEYVTIEQDSMCVDVYRRQENWERTRYLEGSEVEFKSIELVLPIEDVYEDIEFEYKTREIKVLKLV